jgi:putative tryptophan/tyrosine transport system substrate-binding protein
MALIGVAALARPASGFAQATTERPVVAILTPRQPEAMGRYTDAFAQAMQSFGLVQGRDYEIVLRSTESDPTRIPKLLTELIALNPKMILTTDTPLTLAAKRATKEIPIVGVLIADPVGFGLVASVAHPGGNVTGLLSSIDRLVPKQLNLLLQVVPAATRVGVLFNANNPANVAGMSFLQTDSAARSLTLVPAGLRQSSEIDGAIQGFQHQHLDALFVFQDGLFSRNAERIAALALAGQLPTVFGFREFVEVGGLMSYGLNLVSQWQRAASYAAKIMQGTNPGDLPVEMQPKLELVINLKTAKALGITIPASVLAFADSLIE